MLLLAYDPGHPSAAYWANASFGCSRKPSSCEVAAGAMVGGRYGSSRGSIAKRLMTSRAAAALSSRIVTRPAYRVSTARRPCTSARSSGRPSRPPGASLRSGLTGSYQTRSAGTVTISRSGQRSAVSLPPKTAPVSRQMVLFSHVASGTGVWP